MSERLEKEYNQFLIFIKESGREHVGKTVAIKGEEILGLYDNYADAADTVYAEHEPGTVLIQEVRESVDALTVTFHTPGVLHRE